jgi:DNA helicase-2/ATP-dependent DNA helicase PcrA
MPRSVSFDNWRPQGIETLEKAADMAVRSTVNTLVVAGPGAGKTELLAQRACYLLQTGVCRAPQRILAISFKRDAARNLAERVEQRCGEELARRFHSQTFDAFAKGLLDRFGQALPEAWRPRPNYKLDVVDRVIERGFRDRLTTIPAEMGGLTPAEAAQVEDSVYRNLFLGRAISSYPDRPTTLSERAVLASWRYLLHHDGRSLVNLPMAGRLAALMLETNPKIVKALRSSYAFVFLDEFQDTTNIHYDLTLAAFHGSDAVLTAVGDSKQSIMRWAMALPKIFEHFKTDFEADVQWPVLNHRSAPRLVQILASIAAEMEPDGKTPEAVDTGKDGDGECRVLIFPKAAVEGRTLAGLLKQWTQKDGIKPRDICILARQTPDRYCAELVKELERQKVPARIESLLQDLLSEPVTTTVLDFLKLAVRPQAPESWTRLSLLLLAIDGGDSGSSGRRVSERLGASIASLSKLLKTDPANDETVKAAIKHVMDSVTRSGLVSCYPQYEQGDFLDTQLAQLAEHLPMYLHQDGWSDGIERFEGKDAIPIMTVHKSKGLEYHTVIFVGLEDWAFRSFERWQDDEAACAFFVAFSRAKKRVLFTFSRERDSRTQGNTTVKPFYSLLKKVGVPFEKVDA